MKSKTLILSTIGIITLIFITYIILNYKYCAGNSVLKAGREYGICYTELTLNDNGTFIEEVDCLKSHTTKGEYYLINDTIYFDSYISDKLIIEYGLITTNLYGNQIFLYDENGFNQRQLNIEFNRLN